MDPQQLQILGFVAGILTTAAFVPQVVRVWRTRSTTDISLAMFLLFSLGVLLWLVYGVSIRSTPVVAANAVTLVLSVAILMAKLRFK
jgi:MtN3 and saliva related transmembrane protein